MFFTQWSYTKFLFFMVYSGHEESYNPSVEYIPTQEEIDSYQLMYEEDRPKFIPKRYCPFFLFDVHCLIWSKAF